jgi:pimeloyl-ACP methyl ester carboxylesterase
MEPRMEPRMVQVRNAWVRVRTAGPSVGAASAAETPVVLVHGFGSRLESWRAVQPELAKARRTLAFDQRGFGQSERTEGEYGVQAHAEDLLALMDAEHIERAVLVGHSYGAGVVLRAALIAPKRVAGIVLVSPFACSAQMNDFLSWSQLPLMGEWLFATSYKDFPGEKMQLAFAAPDAHAQAGARRPSDAITLDALDEVRANQAIPGTTYAALATVRGMDYDDIEPKYAAIQAPIAVVWGERDRVTPIHDSAALLALLPKTARVLRLPDAGHMPPWEAPDVIVSAIETIEAPR